MGEDSAAAAEAGDTADTAPYPDEPRALADRLFKQSSRRQLGIEEEDEEGAPTPVDWRVVHKSLLSAASSLRASGRITVQDHNKFKTCVLLNDVPPQVLDLGLHYTSVLELAWGDDAETLAEFQEKLLGVCRRVGMFAR
jgi:hypothetical protein